MGSLLVALSGKFPSKRLCLVNEPMFEPSLVVTCVKAVAGGEICSRQEDISLSWLISHPQICLVDSRGLKVSNNGNQERSNPRSYSWERSISQVVSQDEISGSFVR